MMDVLPCLIVMRKPYAKKDIMVLFAHVERDTLAMGLTALVHIIRVVYLEETSLIPGLCYTNNFIIKQYRRLKIIHSLNLGGYGILDFNMQ